MNESLKLCVQKITKLPTIPDIAQEILKLVRDEHVSIQELENIVQKDPSISAKIMSYANSVFFGFTTSANTIGNAIARIGFDNMRNICLGISLITVLEEKNAQKKDSYERIFQHCVSVGIIVQHLSKELKLNILDEVMISAIIHDIGFLVMNRYFPENYMKVLKALEHDKPLLELEKDVYGFTHAEIGNWLAEKWNLPDSILDVTLYHHGPSHATRNIKQVAVTHIADYITTKDIARATKHDPDYPFDPSSLEILNISETELNDVTQRINKDPVF